VVSGRVSARYDSMTSGAGSAEGPGSAGPAPMDRCVESDRDGECAVDHEWMAEGNCRFEPPATFFPSDGVGVEVAKRICATCPVKEPCLEYALEFRIDHGVWGGTSERQRRRILRQRGGSSTSDVVRPLGV
jgi:WhiB family transcriptional regulator, redox-sensing transcriptional regulator